MYKYECKICRNEFTRDWEDKKRTKPKYCSRICYGIAREEKHVNLIGKKIGRLTVISISKERSKRGHVKLKCLCDCGNEKNIPAHHFEEGELVSCGCWKSGKERSFPTFLKKIEKTDGCWIWKGQINKSGYGRHCCKYAHRLSYEYYIGEIPMDKIICHKCNNKICVNPDHIYAGTYKDNTQDLIETGGFKLNHKTNPNWTK